MTDRFSDSHNDKTEVFVQPIPANPESSPPEVKRETKASSACPRCGQHRLVQVSRRGIDRFIGLFVSLRRFRCKNMECRWEGNLVKSRTLRRTVGHIPTFSKQVNWLLVAANAIMLLTIVVIIVALLIGWIDGSLEGYDGIFSRFTRPPE